MRILGKSLLAAATTLGASLALLPSLPTQAAPDRDPSWQETVVDADQSFRGLDAVDRRTAWASGGSISGGAGSVWRTTDGGETWTDVSPPGTTGLSLRDVEARDGDTAVVLSIGNGEASRIWRTDDGGRTWTETFRNTVQAAFYNCLDFYPGGRRGLAVSDPVGGKFRILATEDGGRSWDVLPTAGMPDSTGEANFSASGDCLVVAGRDAWFGTGGDRARVFHSTDRGLTWEATDSMIRAGAAAGVFGLAFRTPRHGVAVGGDFNRPGQRHGRHGRHAQRPSLDGRRRPRTPGRGRRLAARHRPRRCRHRRVRSRPRHQRQHRRRPDLGAVRRHRVAHARLHPRRPLLGRRRRRPDRAGGRALGVLDGRSDFLQGFSAQVS